jgi:uncharacterized phage protein gp47/JayE
MAFVPRSFETILADMIAHVRANTSLTDFSVGSVIRTILEACALEDDEQYYQMVQLLDAFSYQTASGTNLDERAADFNLSRLESAAAVGYVQFRNGALETDELQFNVSSGGSGTTIELTDSSDFPVSGYPYTIRIGEGTAQVEDTTISNNDTTTNIMTTGGLTNSHSIGDRVSLVTGWSDQDVTAGTSVQVPSSGDDGPIIYLTTELVTVVAGDYESNLASVAATDNGSLGNVGVGRITQFSGSLPFTGAEVTNPSATGGGRDRELDTEFRDRLRARLNELSRGTPNAVESCVRGLEHTETGQRVVSSQLLEDFTDNEHSLFIDDGTGFIPTSVQMARSNLASGYGSGAPSIQVDDSSSFPASGTILIDPGDTTNAEIIDYTSKTDSTGTLTLDGTTASPHLITEEVVLVDAMPVAEEGQNYFNLTNYPMQENSPEIYHNESGGYVLQTAGTDYFLNRTNGQLQFYGAGLASGTQVIASYTYYTGLVQLAQKVINGDKDNSSTYPGYSAAGIIVHIDTPTIRRITVVMAISVSVGYDETEIRDDVTLVLENYINSLKIGENVILAKMVELAMGVEGVSDANVVTPVANVVILEEELPKSFDSSGNSLITVV